MDGQERPIPIITDGGRLPQPDPIILVGQERPIIEGGDQAYNPCSGKSDGDECKMCAPGEKFCLETMEKKTCQSGQCISQRYSIVGEGETCIGSLPPPHAKFCEE